MTGPLIFAPDVEQALIDWFPVQMSIHGWDVAVSDTLAPLGSIQDDPDNMFDDWTTDESMAVYRTGGPMKNLVTDWPTIVVETKGRTKKRSYDMLAMARALIYQAQSTEVLGVTIQQVQEFSGPAHLPSEESPTRYTMTLSLSVTAATG